ncbi:OmpW/AlkL family protein [Thalassotalea aquiviva]|uniref:OmpW/AlkL family protein n=1 Tax=Thalassotalea aquiviva TaxID=3242415 RepID=UPI00352B116B
MKKQILGVALVTLLAGPTVYAAGHQAGDYVVRGGVTLVEPDNDKAGVNVPALGGPTALSVSVEANSQLGLNLVYFYDANWAVELLAATPFTHDVTIHDPEGIAPGVFSRATLDIDGAKLGEVDHLPPTLSALYYFNTDGNFKPYVGVGINYTIFFKDGFTSGAKTLGFNDLSVDSSWGLSAQLGLDYIIDDKWHLNASARYIDIDTDATFKIGNEIKGSANIGVDPMVYSLMLGYTF